MADRKESDSGVLGRLAGRGEDAVTRLMDELGRNPRVTDALGRAMAAKGKVDQATRKTLGQVGLAPSDELKELRRRIDRLENRLAKLEAGGTRSRSRSGRASTTSTKASGGTAKRTQRSRSGSTSRSRSRGGSSGSS